MVQARRLARMSTAFVGALALAIVGCSNGGGGAVKSPTLGDAAIRSVKVVASTGADSQPIDAAPGPDGQIIYFTAGGTGAPAVLGVPAAGGATFPLAVGAPLVKPVGLAVATDGMRVFVADPQAGRIFSIPSGGGAPTVVAGTEGRSPRGLDVAAAGTSDMVYFTGIDPADGAAGLFSVPAAGGTVTVIAKGAPIVAPDAVVVGGEGTFYLTDRGTTADQGAVLKISRSGVARIAGSRLGDPGGVSLTGDGKTLLVSSLNATTAGDQVLMVDLATGETGTASKVIGANHNTSGGLHRALHASRFAWADGRRSGTVYRLDL